MSLLDLGAVIYYPERYPLFNITTTSLNTANGRVGHIVLARKAGLISEVHVYVASVTTPGTLSIRLETIGSDGYPSGTLIAGGAEGSMSIGAGDGATWKTALLDTPASVSLGQLICLVLQNPESGYPEITIHRNAQMGSWDLPYGFFNSGTNGKLHASLVAVLRYGNDYVATYGLTPSHSIYNQNFNTGSTFQECGNRMMVPFRCRTVGVCVLDGRSAGAAGRFVLYDQTDAELARTVSITAAMDAANGSPSMIHFDASPVLEPGRVYRLVLVAENANNNTVRGSNYQTEYSSAMPGGGNIYLTYRRTGESWTDVPSVLVASSLMIDAIDVGGPGRGPTLAGGAGIGAFL